MKEYWRKRKEQEKLQREKDEKNKYKKYIKQQSIEIGHNISELKSGYYNYNLSLTFADLIKYITNYLELRNLYLEQYIELISHEIDEVRYNTLRDMRYHSYIISDL